MATFGTKSSIICSYVRTLRRIGLDECCMYGVLDSSPSRAKPVSNRQSTWTLQPPGHYFSTALANYPEGSGDRPIFSEIVETKYIYIFFFFHR